MSLPRVAIAGLAAVLLAACASQPTRPPEPVDEALARSHDAQRLAITGWRLAGRVAVSTGSQGGSGRIEWEQQGDRYTISLGAPVTRQSWRLAGDSSGAKLDGVDGGPLQGEDAEHMLLVATGWRIPVQAMVAWVRGIAAADGITAPARILYGPGNVPSTLEQIGWRIDYRDWHPATATRPALPRRIEAVDVMRGDAKLRLIVDEWQVDRVEPVAAAVAIETPEALLERTLLGLDIDEPGADMRRHVAAGDRRPLAVCGFACRVPGDVDRTLATGDARILDGSGDVVSSDHQLQPKHRAGACARACNEALLAWRAAHPEGASPEAAD